MGVGEEVEKRVAASGAARGKHGRKFRGLRRVVTAELIVIAGLVLSVAAFYAVMNTRGWLAASRYKAELKRRGDSLDLPQMTPEKLAQISASDRIATRLESLGPHTQTLENLLNVPLDVRNGTPVDLVAFAKSCLTNSPPGLTAFKPPETQEEAASLILEALALRDPYLTELRSACQRPELIYPFGYDSPRSNAVPRIFGAINACRELRLRVLAELALGKTSAGLDDLDLMLRISDSLRGSPELISLIGSLACRHIALTTLWAPLAERRFDEAALRRLQALLGPVDLISDFPRAARHERNWTFAQLERARASGKSAIFGASGARLLQWLPRGWMDLEKVTTAKHSDAFFVDAFAEWPNRIRVDSLLAARTNVSVLRNQGNLAAFWEGSVLAGMFAPKLEESAMNAIVAQVLTDQARVICALERFYLEHGNYPESLSVLMHQELKEMPKDPLSGTDYGYALDSATSYRVWSVGPNQKDDAGRPGATGRYSGADPDWVWRVR